MLLADVLCFPYDDPYATYLTFSLLVFWFPFFPFFFGGGGGSSTEDCQQDAIMYP